MVMMVIVSDTRAHLKAQYRYLLFCDTILLNRAILCFPSTMFLPHFVFHLHSHITLHLSLFTVVVPIRLHNCIYHAFLSLRT